jgi:hypothetical protein
MFNELNKNDIHYAFRDAVGITFFLAVIYLTIFLLNSYFPLNI